MPAPANAEELLDLIQKSGVVDEAKLRTYVQKLNAANGLPKDPAKLAGHLVRDAILTYFQAEQLLQGKYKRFSIGKYKVLEKLGAGGMAQVFLCEHKLMRRRVAIKVLPTAKAEDPSSLERFYREARAVAAVDHPNIVRAYDIDQDENLHFLVMEYVDGTNLQDLVKKFGPLDIVRACHYIYGAAVGLQHAHEIGLVHRDIKPGNILIDRSGVVKILDMGLARFFHDDDDALTKKYDENVLGTADYLAPEQALDSHTVDIRADIYSLGATFYYLLTASALFPEGSVAQKLIWHQSRQPRPIRSLRPETPDDIVAVVDRMMAKDPGKRYQTPADILTALAPWVATPIPPPADREMPQVSPAAGGTGTANRVAISAPQKGFTPDAPTVIASSQMNTPTSQMPALTSQATAQLPANANAAVWESLDTDTPQTVSKGDSDTARTVKPSDPPSKKRKYSGSRPGSGGLLIAGIAVLLLAGAAAGVYFAFFKKPAATIDVPSTGVRRILVSKDGKDGALKSLREAISAANPGDTIAITDPSPLIETKLDLTAKHKGLTIESGLPDGKPAVIAFSQTKTGLTLTSVEDVHLKNLEFDGKFDGKLGVLTGIVITGVCPGCTLENVSVQKVKTAVLLNNARGESGSPITIERLRAFNLLAPAEAKDAACTGIHIMGTGGDTRSVKIRNCRFEGGTDGIRVDASWSTSDLDIADNRFFKTANAMTFGRPPAADKKFQARIANNTIFEARAGLYINITPAQPPQPNTPPPPFGNFDLVFTQNYFAKTAEIGKLEGGARPPNIKTENNASDANNGGSLGIVPVVLAPPPRLDENLADDARFLRFPNGQPEIGQPKVKVGAQAP